MMDEMNESKSSKRRPYSSMINLRKASGDEDETIRNSMIKNLNLFDDKN